MRRVPRDLYSDAWRRPLFAQRLARKGSLSRYVRPLLLSSLKGRSLKYVESVVNRRSLRNRARRCDEKRRKASIIGAVRSEQAVLFAVVLAIRPISHGNKSKYVQGGMVQRGWSTSRFPSIGDHRHQRLSPVSTFYKIVLKGIRDGAVRDCRMATLPSIELRAK